MLNACRKLNQCSKSPATPLPHSPHGCNIISEGAHPRRGLADEIVLLKSSRVRGGRGAATYRELEEHASARPGIEFVALRYGFFHPAPGTHHGRERCRCQLLTSA